MSETGSSSDRAARDTTREARARHERLSEVFLRAQELEGSARDAYIIDACGSDGGLRADVLALLAEAAGPDSFLDAPVGSSGLVERLVARTPGDGDGWGDAGRHPARVLSGTRIGGYLVGRVLGAGGMGTVYEAEQESPHRRVALKVVRASMATRDALRRLRYESEVLGRLRHPNIAQIYSAGTFEEDGAAVPFFAMELLEGARTIVQHAEAEAMAIRDRVRLFAGVCGAVHFGHQKGVVHRDLKPGNVLVDRDGVVKVIDYGVARCTGADMTLSTMRTATGRLVGTMRYMSPEQCAGRIDEVDVRSDVYSLGVVLFELLTGRLPYDLGSTSIAASARVIETCEPLRPSTLRTELRGDLETILLKALEKPAERRYASAAAMEQDLHRWLEHRPIEARPASVAYQLRKLAARHRPMAVAVAVGGLALVAAAIVSAAMAVRATRAAEAERVQQERLAGLNSYLSSILTSVDPEQARTGDVTVREMLDHALARVGRELADEPLMAASVRHTIGQTFLGVGALAEAEAALRQALGVRERMLGDDLQTMESLVRLGDVLIELGRTEEAADALGRAVAMAERMDVLERETIAIDALGGLGTALARGGDLNQGEVLLERAIEIGARAGFDERVRLSQLNNLGMLRHHKGNSDGAVELLRACAEGRARVLGPDHPETLTTLNNLGSVLTDAGEAEEAERLLREVVDARARVLGPDHPRTLSSINNLSIVLSRLEQNEEAERLIRRVYEARRATLGEDNPDTITAAMNLATHLERHGARAESESILCAYEPIVERTLAPEHPLRLYASSQLVRMNMRHAEYEEAEAIARRCLAALRGVVAEDHWQVWRFTSMIGAAVSAQGRDEEAERLLRAGRDGLEAALGPDHSWTRWAQARLDEHLGVAIDESPAGDHSDG